MAKKNGTDKQIVNREPKPWWFKPGQSGNPAGRPKGKRPSEIMREMFLAQYGGPEAIRKLQETMPEPWRSMNVDKMTVGEIISWVQLRRAMTANADKARSDLFDRLEGRPTMRIEVEPTKDDDSPLRLEDFTEEELRALHATAMKAMERKQGK